MTTFNLAVLSTEEMADILQKIADIESAINEGVSLRPSDRQKLLKLGSKRTQFVQRTIEMTQQNPAIAPGYIDRTVMESNYAVYNQMLTMKGELNRVLRKVEDRLMVAGSAAHKASLSCYKSIKNASRDNVPGAEPVYTELKTRFKPGKRKPGGENPDAVPEPAGG